MAIDFPPSAPTSSHNSERPFVKLSPEDKADAVSMLKDMLVKKQLRPAPGAPMWQVVHPPTKPAA
jgi:hypothetical protein